MTGVGGTHASLSVWCAEYRLAPGTWRRHGVSSLCRMAGGTWLGPDLRGWTGQLSASVHRIRGRGSPERSVP